MPETIWPSKQKIFTIWPFITLGLLEVLLLISGLVYSKVKRHLAVKISGKGMWNSISLTPCIHTQQELHMFSRKNKWVLILK